MTEAPRYHAEGQTSTVGPRWQIWDMTDDNRTVATDSELLEQLTNSVRKSTGPLPADLVHKARIAAGFSVPEMAEIMRFTEPHYSAIENGLRCPSARFIRQFANACAAPTKDSPA